MLSYITSPVASISNWFSSCPPVTECQAGDQILTGVPVTRAYIYDNGRPTVGTLDGDWVTFTTGDGVEYTLESNFFSPAVFPDRDAYIPGGQGVVVRYLPSHPQAFVIDSSQLPE
jgi:hypothetical protein